MYCSTMKPSHIASSMTERERERRGEEEEEEEEKAQKLNEINSDLHSYLKMILLLLS